jgi:GNAT superfamily N-acetyltransferase
MGELMGLKIILFNEQEHAELVPELTELLHQAYKPLADRGFRYSATYQPPETTLKRLKYFESYLAYWSGQLAGTIALIQWKPDSPCEYYRKEGIYHFGQFAVKPEFQGRGIANQLLLRIEERTKQLRGKELALDTAEGAVELIEMYKRRGFKAVSTTKWASTNYQSIVMTKEISS